ncbi:MAG: hypothetical protein ACO3UU_05765 [Minisyncoccia bacterium]
MSQPFTDNNGTTYYNINVCRSYSLTLAGSLVAFESQPCSEVVIINTSGAVLSAFDSGYSSPANALIIPTNAIVEVRGITNASQVSAIGSGTFSYRTQFFSNNPQR